MIRYMSLKTDGKRENEKNGSIYPDPVACSLDMGFDAALVGAQRVSDSVEYGYS